MGNQIFKIKRNDTGPTLVSKLILNDSGVKTVFPLEDGSTVLFNMRRVSDNELVIDRADGSFYNRLQGQIAYNFTAAQTAISGIYEGEFRILKNDGQIISVPTQPGLFLVQIGDDVDGS